MKMHPSFSVVLAAARKQLKVETDAKQKARLKEAIENVSLFKLDNHDFVLYYGEDVEMK